MSEIILELLFSSLVNAVPKTIAILIPLIGAFWIFKVREHTVAEGKIFETGREIANILQSKEIRGPLDLVASHYIDQAKSRLKEPNHEKALNKILKSNLYCFNSSNPGTEEQHIESAEAIVALATSRWQGLVPPGVTWSGRGGVYSPFGEETRTDDNYYPFGTKLYREWIEKFSDISRDLWAITNARKQFVDEFLSKHANQFTGVDKKFLTDWLDSIEDRMKEIRPLHAKLLTQIQNMDAQVALPRLGRDIRRIFFYLLLLAIAGYFEPRALELAGLASLEAIAPLAFASILAYSLIIFRFASAAKPEQDQHVHRKIFLPPLRTELREMERRCVRYRSHVVANIVSLKSEIRLRRRLRRNLTALALKIDEFNQHAGELFGAVTERVKEVGIHFPTHETNQSGFGVNIAELPSEAFDAAEIRKRISQEEGNFVFSAEETRASRTLLKINLGDLNLDQKRALVDAIDRLRFDLNAMPAYEATMKSFDELQRLRRASLKDLERIVES